MGQAFGLVVSVRSLSGAGGELPPNPGICRRSPQGHRSCVQSIKLLSPDAPASPRLACSAWVDPLGHETCGARGLGEPGLLTRFPLKSWEDCSSCLSPRAGERLLWRLCSRACLLPRPRLLPAHRRHALGLRTQRSGWPEPLRLSPRASHRPQPPSPAGRPEPALGGTLSGQSVPQVQVAVRLSQQAEFRGLAGPTCDRAGGPGRPGRLPGAPVQAGRAAKLAATSHVPPHSQL